MEKIIELEHIYVKKGKNVILDDISLTIYKNDFLALIGPNGSGKTTLANLIAGKNSYPVTSGEIRYKGKNITDSSPEERALNGIFLSFQYPVVIPGVNTTYFLKEALNAKRRNRGEDEINAADFMRLIKEKLKEVDLDETYLKRSVNDGFSGGEKKRNEILQMLILEPELAVLDETDSGLDIDALKTIAHGINQYRREDRAIILITHYQRLLKYTVPDYVHVLMNGHIVKSGGKELALELEEKGYRWVEEEVAA